jgi:hypothetical protein
MSGTKRTSGELGSASKPRRINTAAKTSSRPPGRKSRYKILNIFEFTDTNGAPVNEISYFPIP